MDIFLTLLYLGFLIDGAEMFFGRRRDKCDEPGNWLNCYCDSIKFQCNSQETINSMTSKHDGFFKDRVWAFTCKKTLPSAGRCYWTEFVNDYDNQMDYTCPLGAVVSGVQSEHDRYYHDRRWKFYCCRATSEYNVNCQESKVVNEFKKEMGFTIPDGYVLVGAYSTHDNYYEDRIWKYRFCKSK